MNMRRAVGPRLYSSAATSRLKSSVASRMSAWQLNSYDKLPGLVLNSSARVPTLERPNDVLIEVYAASVNPLDVQMANGFGRAVIGAMRQMDQRSAIPVVEFPLTLGRDCSGVVVETGRNVNNVKRGDEVWCAISAARQGTFGQYVSANGCTVAKKPENVTDLEAASMPYVACTVWTALRYAAMINAENGQGLRALVFGGSGGIGTFAVQLLRVWGVEVTATCRRDAIPLLTSLGATSVVDYTAPDAWDQLVQNAPYDVILDPVFTPFSRRSTDLLKHWKGSTYISITNPLLDDCDQHGLLLGFMNSTRKFTKDFFQCLQQGRIYTWAYVVPDGRILKKLTELVENGKIRPVVDKVFEFDQLPSAMEKVAQGNARGKVVVEMMSNASE